MTLKMRGENQRYSDVWFVVCRRRSSKLAILPLQSGFRLALRLSNFVCVFNYCTHAGVAKIGSRFAENIHTRRIHRHDCADAFCGPKPQDVYVGLRGNRTAIERDDLKLVCGKREPVRFGRAGVEDGKEDSLARFYLNRIGMT